VTKKEATISFTDSDLVDLIPAWAEIGPGLAVPTGLSVREALSRSDMLWRQAAAREVPIDAFRDKNETADCLYAVCRILMETCVQAPLDTLNVSKTLHHALRASGWEEDDLEERESLLCTLAFVAWRASRLLDRSPEVHRWEAEYKSVFRHSLAYEVTASTLPSDAATSRQALLSGPETLFQILIYCQDHGEVNPQRVADGLLPLYQLLKTDGGEDADLQSFFLGEGAKLVGAALRSVGGPTEVGDWLDRAEEHFRSGVNPKPGLAKVLFQRLAACYMASRFDLVTKACPRLEADFLAMGMDEDRVKCLILWAGSLKLQGLLQEALAILEPVRQSRSQIRPELYGWVLLQCGDIQQTLGNHDRALRELGEAARLLREGKQFIALADINWMISCIFRANGRFDEAVALLEASRQDHARLGMKWPEAYHRVLLAETYLAMGRPREAEIEIRAALPILEEQGMLADAVIAVNLLREAVRQRKLLPADIRDLRKPKA
jgi:tetratricopeptide (TPR) repeat protein